MFICWAGGLLVCLVLGFDVSDPWRKCDTVCDLSVFLKMSTVVEEPAPRGSAEALYIGADPGRTLRVGVLACRPACVLPSL